MKITLLCILQFASVIVFSQTIETKFEKSYGKETPTYFEIIDWWKKLDEQSAKIKMHTMGMTDAGYQLHLILINNNQEVTLNSIKKSDKRIIFINNGIHPGEPDGIDASILLARDIVSNKLKLADNVILAIIPVYNIGGCLNRSANYRVDQNGPEEFGSRGNSQNLDLNRDFIKNDSKDSKAFIEIFHLLNPDVFLDNHVSNGADYQHVMSLISTQHNKLGGEMGEYLNKIFEPTIYTKMKQKGYDLIPYVNSFGETPENGWPEFWDAPRYSSGYAALWNTFSFIAETHMLKPYDQRVKATYDLMNCIIDFTSKNSTILKTLRDKTKLAIKTQQNFTISWELDRSKNSTILYKGFKSEHKLSEISQKSRLLYDRTKPYEKTIPFYNFYKPKTIVSKPKAYIIPQGWWKVIELLKLNKIQMTQFKKDTLIEVEVYRIDDYKTTPRQYEMHHPNTDVKISTSVKKIKFRKGDWYISMNQTANHFLIETLEPQSEDSYFSWNFFDAVLSQKEGYSAYVFEDIAATYLNTNSILKQKLEQRRNSDSSFVKNGRAQLNFIYENSPWYEPDYLKYPIYRVK